MANQYWIVTLSLSTVIILTRSLPFLFSDKMGDAFNKIGKLLPGYIMLCLVVYEIHPKSFTQPPYAIPDILGLFMVFLIFKTMHNMVFSLILSFVVYLLCRHWLG
ncbi:AzlD domain-containing protein [Legionella sp. W05-934-2]|jgi:branched-subunit amino acid transport protein AzlD|uniref:AzlD domain-containing protein n=1 Tax=Legionella sp. W05-934-2 TaxID=1198649 RepID=UPI003462B349